MAVTINGNGAVTGLTALPDSAMASGSIINTSSVAKTNTASESVSQGAVSSALISLSYAAASSSNKLVIVANVNLGSQSPANIFATLLIDGSASTYIANAAGNRQRASSASAEAAAANIASFTIVFELSSPSTSSTVYGIGASHAQDDTETMYINRTHGNTNVNYVGRTASSLTIFEVAA